MGASVHAYYIFHVVDKFCWRFWRNNPRFLELGFKFVFLSVCLIVSWETFSSISSEFSHQIKAQINQFLLRFETSLFNSFNFKKTCNTTYKDSWLDLSEKPSLENTKTTLDWSTTNISEWEGYSSDSTRMGTIAIANYFRELKLVWLTESCHFLPLRR